MLADVSAKGAAYNVRVNVQALEDRSKGESLVRRADELVKQASDLAARTCSVVESALSK